MKMRVGVVLVTFFMAGADVLPVCYNDSNGCDPHDMKRWPELCRIGTRQSPINLPPMTPVRQFQVELSNYKCTSFRLKSSGHSATINWQDQGAPSPKSERFTFPCPEDVTKEPQEYKLASTHFHWGNSDMEGSEHAFAGKRTSMELHLVHYLAFYGSITAALESADVNALTILAIPIHLEDKGKMVTETHRVLLPIVNNLDKLAIKSDQFVTINEPLNLKDIFTKDGDKVYSYKGSLTRPDCSEQVNWFVLHKPIGITREHLKRFWNLRDAHKGAMRTGSRSVMDLHGRKIACSLMLPA